MIRRIFCLAAPVLFLLAPAFAPRAFAQEDVVTVKSPDGRIEFRLFDGPQWAYDLDFSHLAYQIDFDGKRLIDTSHLGFEIENALPLGHKLGLVRTQRDVVDETLPAPAGKSRTIRNRFNEVIAEYLQNGSLGRLLNMEVRVFNEGVAFRYVIPPSPPLQEMRIPSEITQFNFARDGSAYPLLLRDFQSSYEDTHVKITLSGIHPESIIGAPFLLEQPGVAWVAITEADLDDYAGMYLVREEGRRLRVKLSPLVDGSGLAVVEKTPMVTPWRVVLIADTPVKLLESNLIASLNAPSKLPSEIEGASWLRPGKAIGSPAASVRAAIDFAADTGLEYVLVEPGWAPLGAGGAPDLLRTAPDFDLSTVLMYANQKKVGLWLTAPWRAVESQMEEAFALFERMGIRGLVIDGPSRDDQPAVKFQRTAAAKASLHRLMLVFHGAHKPDGMSRTFPNVLSTEAVLGSEYAKWGARATPEHNAMVAFTRLLAGSVDYAPGGFDNVTPAAFQAREDRPMTLGTRAHQLALFVIFESPFQRLGDRPQAYAGQRELEFLKVVPAAWDETRALAGEPGQFAAVARKRGNDWFLGAITNGSAREFDVPLAFLGAGNFTAEIYSDGPNAAANPKQTAIEQRPVNAQQTLHLKLAPGGGTAIRFKRGF